MNVGVAAVRLLVSRSVALNTLIDSGGTVTVTRPAPSAASDPPRSG